MMEDYGLNNLCVRPEYESRLRDLLANRLRNSCHLTGVEEFSLAGISPEGLAITIASIEENSLN